MCFKTKKVMYLYQVSCLGSALWDPNKLACWEEAFEGSKKRQCRDEVYFEALWSCGVLYFGVLIRATLRGWGMAQSVTYLLHKHEGLSLILRTHVKKLDIIPALETGGSLGLVASQPSPTW